MKKRRNIIAALTLFTTLSLTACAGNSTGESNNTQQSSSSVTEAAESTDDLQAQLTALYEQEQKIFDGHKDTWDKVFEVMDKVESDSDYADFLLSAVEYNKNNLSSEELDMLTKDIEAIRGIEKDINDIAEKLLSNDSYVSSVDTAASSDDSDAFKNISGTDLDGNEIDQSLISDSTVTVLNFWFSGCKPCVAELSKLNELNETISPKGGQVIGVNVNTFDGNDSAIEEAKGILESQGAKYRNICFASDSDAGKYALDIMAFPTTILVDRNGNIVGQPLLGGIDNEENFNKLMEQIQSVMDADNAD